jgi:protein-S-isoprenylcysteine O-methyltransferase Ste14
MRRLARARVPLGFLAAAAALVLARPSRTSWLLGLAMALPGEGLRIWAAGHIEKGREITRSGPSRLVRHPLYLGSTLLGAGFAVASRNWVVVLLTVLYLGLTLWAAVRTEEATLDSRFAGAYAVYRAGQAAPVRRAFDWRRAVRNREHRAVLGLVVAFGYLAIRAW